MSNEGAEDVAHDFFLHLLQRRTLGAASPKRGRFRTFMAACLKNFWASERARRRSLKRGGSMTQVPLEELPLEDETSGNGHERLFDRIWARQVMRLAWAELRSIYQGRRLGEHFEKLHVILSGAPGRRADLAKETGCTRTALEVELTRLRRHFRETVKAVIRNTLARPEDTENEYRHLIQVLGGSDFHLEECFPESQEPDSTP